MHLSKPLRSPIFTLTGWILILPATALIAAAVLRQLQPRQFEPARTTWLIFDWTASHISRSGAGVLFLALPALVCFAGFVALWGMWRENQTFRSDVLSSLAILRRHLSAALLAVATLLAGSILLLVVSHIITD